MEENLENINKDENKIYSNSWLIININLVQNKISQFFDSKKRLLETEQRTEEFWRNLDSIKRELYLIQNESINLLKLK